MSGPIRIELTYFQEPEAPGPKNDWHGRLGSWGGQAQLTPEIFEAIYSESQVEVLFDREGRCGGGRRSSCQRRPRAWPTSRAPAPPELVR